MSDGFDGELRQALKDSTAKSLEGWEFTPAMRQAVRERIAQEAPSEAPKQDLAPQPAPPTNPRRGLTRPLVWVAAAAAVLLFSLNMNELMDSPGGARKESSTAGRGVAPESASQSTSKSQAKQGESAGPATGAGEGNQTADLASRTDAADDTGDTEATGASGATALSSPETATFGRDTFAITEVDANMAAEVSGQASLAGNAGTPFAVVVPGGQPAKARLYLVAPNSVVRKDSTTSGEMGIGILAVKPASGMVSLGTSRGGLRAVLTTESVQMVDAQGEVAWERSLPASPHLVATASNGRTAVGVGSQLFFFTAEGGANGQLKLEAPATNLSLGLNGRLAVVAGGSMRFYQAGKLLSLQGNLVEGSTAFAPDGSLALLAREGQGRTLYLFGQGGTPLVKVPVAAGSDGLAFLEQGEYVIAGGQVFHRSGKAVWKVSFPVQGVSVLKEGVVAWGKNRVSLLRSADGAEIWTAEYDGGTILKVTASESGEQVAILGSVADGAVVWVLDAAGGQRFVERISTMPLDLAVEGDSLMLLMPDSLEVRSIQP